VFLLNIRWPATTVIPELFLYISVYVSITMSVTVHMWAYLRLIS